MGGVVGDGWPRPYQVGWLTDVITWATQASLLRPTQPHD